MSELNQGKIEVELKAWVDDLNSLEQKIKQKAEFVGEFIEEDIYFTFAHTKGYQKQRFRLRKVNDKAVVTVKIEGSAEPGIEANQEFEFEVSDPQAFKVFCREFGFRVLIEKRKKVKRYCLKLPSDDIANEITIELNQVEHLGNFVELEILVDEPSKVNLASEHLKQLLSELGISPSQIEPRPYTELLYQKLYSSSK